MVRMAGNEHNGQRRFLVRSLAMGQSAVSARRHRSGPVGRSEAAQIQVADRVASCARECLWRACALPRADYWHGSASAAGKRSAVAFAQVRQPGPPHQQCGADAGNT
jgi:hypothetical protein